MAHLAAPGVEAVEYLHEATTEQEEDLPRVRLPALRAHDGPEEQEGAGRRLPELCAPPHRLAFMRYLPLARRDGEGVAELSSFPSGAVVSSRNFRGIETPYI